MQETQVQSLGQEDSLEKEMATALIFLPGESHGERSLVGYSVRGYKELDKTERLTDTETETHTHRQSSLLNPPHTKKQHYVNFQGMTTKIVKSNDLPSC